MSCIKNYIYPHLLYPNIIAYVTPWFLFLSQQMNYDSDNTEKHNFKKWSTQNNYTHNCQLLSLSPNYEVYIVWPYIYTES